MPSQKILQKGHLIMKKIIVIGAGILGASTAYHLAKRGADVTIIDRHDEGQATEAAAGIIGPWLAQRRNKAWYFLARHGAKYYPELIDELKQHGETNTGYTRVGLLSLHTEERKLLAAEERVLKRREDAPEIGDVKILNEKETKEAFPLLEDGRFKSIYVSGAARVDGSAVRHALLGSAKTLGATIRRGDARLIHTNNRVYGVNVDGEQIEADLVIAATGAWMNDLLAPLQISFGAYPQKAQIMHLKVPEMRTDDLPVVMPPNNQYILPFEQNHMVIGATHETSAGFDPRVTAGGIHEILTKALDIVPALANSTIIETKVGYRPFTPGSLPVIGALPGFDGLLLANGLGASGLTVGPYVGNELAKLAFGEKLELDLNNYRVSHAILTEAN